MDRADRLTIAGIAAYAAVACVTFGHAAAQREAKDQARYEACVERNPGVESWRCAGLPESAPLAGLAGGALWPLYWSWEVFS